MQKIIIEQTTWRKDFPHSNVGDCDNSILLAKGKTIDVDHTLMAQGHIYYVPTGHSPDGIQWIYGEHAKIEGTELNNNPKASPLNANALPDVPQTEPTFKVPGISIRLKASSSIYYDGNPTHFTWGEATANGERIPVNAQITANIVKVAGYMDDVRRYLGDKPIGITSWYRDPVTNREIGGARFSQHLEGNAVDFYVVDEDVVDTFEKLKSYIINDGGLAVGAGFVHLDLRGCAARWTYPGGPSVDLW